MSIKKQLFKSFVKGIGKTVGTALIVGVLGTALYMYSNNQFRIKKVHKKCNTEKHYEKLNEDNNINEKDNRDENNNENQTNVDTNEKGNLDENNNENFEDVDNCKYKNLFEKLLK